MNLMWDRVQVLYRTMSRPTSESLEEASFRIRVHVGGYLLSLHPSA